eukprot:833417-Rhodomonas_salina.1
MSGSLLRGCGSCRKACHVTTVLSCTFKFSDSESALIRLTPSHAQSPASEELESSRLAAAYGGPSLRVCQSRDHGPSLLVLG